MNSTIWKAVNIRGRNDLNSRYEVSDAGAVRSSRSGKILAPLNNEAGYIFYHLCADGRVNNYYAHRLVLSAFVPNPEDKPEGNHRDGNRANNELANLEWATPGENILHSFRVLKREPMNGAKNAAAKLSESDIIAIRARWKQGGVTQAELAELWSVSFQNISCIVLGKSWKHVT